MSQDVTQDVVIGFCMSARHGPPPQFVACWTNLLMSSTRDRHIRDVISLASSPRIAAARNMIVEQFLAHPERPPWLLMLDDDILFTPEHVEQLIEVAEPDERPFVSGLYFGGGPTGVIVPQAYKVTSDHGMKAVRGVHNPGEWGSVIEVDVVGAGFMLVHRHVLIDMADNYRATGMPWFAETAGNTGEDVTFCLRARSMAVPIWCHTGILLGHLKNLVVDEVSHRDYLAQEATFGEDGVRKTWLGRLRAVDTSISPGAT